MRVEHLKKSFGAKVIVTLNNGKKLIESLNRADAHPYGQRPFKRKDYINKFLTLTKNKLLNITNKVFGYYIKDPSNSNDKYLRTRIRNLISNLQNEDTNELSAGCIFSQVINPIDNENTVCVNYDGVSFPADRHSKLPFSKISICFCNFLAWSPTTAPALPSAVLLSPLSIATFSALPKMPSICLAVSSASNKVLMLSTKGQTSLSHLPT